MTVVVVDNSLKQKAAQLREYHESKTKSKFEENKTYYIVNCETVKTKYGPAYVITTDKGEKYYANKKVSKYIETNKLNVEYFKHSISKLPRFLRGNKRRVLLSQYTDVVLC